MSKIQKCLPYRNLDLKETGLVKEFFKERQIV